jgi:hypothetical protein
MPAHRFERRNQLAISMRNESRERKSFATIVIPILRYEHDCGKNEIAARPRRNCRQILTSLARVATAA